MDTVKGGFDDWLGAGDTLELAGYEEQIAEETRDAGPNAPPPAIGQDERRMQVRAYNLWADLLGYRAYPDIRDLDASGNPDFADFSILLDFSSGIEDPTVMHLGRRLAEECGATGTHVIGQLSDVPAGSLLSRITDHYVQILARQAPIGFEAEFVNRRGALIVYRGILLPFSSDDRKIDHIYGVLNWKEVADTGIADLVSGELAGAFLQAGEGAVRAEDPLPAPLSRRLRAITPTGFDALDDDGPEFTLLMARRMSSGNVALLGEIPFDPALMRQAANKLQGR